MQGVPGEGGLDSLTALPLRGGFLAAVERAITGLSPSGGSGAVLYFDVDGLAAVNSALGRASGDEVLQSTARALADSLGGGALLARDSGDSFAAFLPGADAASANTAADEARKKAAAAAGEHIGRKITISAGTALFPADGQDAETLLAAARAASRAAKKAGGNATATTASIGAPEGPELVLERLRSLVFAGRRRELEFFRGKLDVCRQETGFIFIRGEPGIGKTRLLRELRLIVRQMKLACAMESCRPSDLMRPYAPLARALAAYADETLSSREALLEGRSPPEANDLLELFARYGVPLGPAPQPQEGPRRHLLRGLMGVLESMARGGAAVLLFDSANWLDRASLELFDAASKERKFGLLICCAINDHELHDDAGRPRPITELCQMRKDLPNLWELRLRRLSFEEAAVMTTAILGDVPKAEDFERALYGLSAGNPLYQEAILRLMAMRMRAGGSAGREISLAGPAIPRTLDATLDTTLAELGTDISEAAAAIAAAGRPVSAGELALAIGRTEGEAVYFIDELVRLRLAEEYPPGSELFVLSSTRFGERALEASPDDFLEVVHTFYATSAEGKDPAEEAYHRRFTSDASALERAESECLRATSIFWGSPELMQERPAPSPSQEAKAGLPRQAGASSRRILRFDAESPQPQPSSPAQTEGDSGKAQAQPPQAPELPSPDRILQVEGIPPGSDPIRLSDAEAAKKLLAALDRLIDDNERPSAAAAIWRVLAAFEIEKGDSRKRLIELLEELEKRIWQIALPEAFKPLEDTLARELRREKDGNLLAMLARSTARAMYAFLRAGEFTRVERLGRILSWLGAEGGTPERSAACAEGFSLLAKTDFYELIMSDLASESPERIEKALAVLKQISRPVRDRLVDTIRTSDDYRVRRAAAEALAASGEEGGIAAIALLGPTLPDEEYERIISVVDALGLQAEHVEEEVIQAINHASERVRRAGVSVASRLSSSSTIGILQSAINAGGSLGALRAMEAVAELRLVDAFPVVQKQLVDSQDAAVLEAAARAIGRMATSPDTPALRAVRLLGTTLNRMAELPDKEEAERATITTLWAISQYRIPEAREILESAKSHASVKIAAFAARLLAELETRKSPK